MFLFMIHKPNQKANTSHIQTFTFTSLNFHLGIVDARKQLLCQFKKNVIDKIAKKNTQR